MSVYIEENLYSMFHHHLIVIKIAKEKKGIFDEKIKEISK